GGDLLRPLARPQPPQPRRRGSPGGRRVRDRARAGDRPELAGERPATGIDPLDAAEPRQARPVGGRLGQSEPLLVAAASGAPDLAPDLPRRAGSSPERTCVLVEAYAVVLADLARAAGRVEDDRLVPGIDHGRAQLLDPRQRLEIVAQRVDAAVGPQADVGR